MYSARLTDGEILQCEDFKHLFRSCMKNLRCYVGDCSLVYPHSDVYSCVIYDGDIFEHDCISICYIWVSNISTQIVSYCGTHFCKKLFIPRIGYRKLLENKYELERRLYHV